MDFYHFALFGVMFAVGTPSMAQTPIEHPKVVIDVVELEGSLLPAAVQERLVASIKEREWEEGSNWEGEVSNMVIRAEKEDWPGRENQGYLNFSLSVQWKPLRREPGLLHVLATIQVNEGQPRRVEKIEIRFAGNQLASPVFDSGILRRLIPLKDGEIFHRDKYRAGLDAVAAIYKERGFIELTYNESLAMNDDNNTVALAVEITAGRRYRWGNIQVLGLDPKIETILRTRLAKQSIVNPKLIRDFYQEYKSFLPVGASPETVEFKRDRQRAVVDVTFDFNTPAPQSIPD
jgi:outer membrane protein assembly factor BamA